MSNPNQSSLPGLKDLRIGGTRIPVKSDRIPHLEILKVLQESDTGRRGLVQIYREEVLPIKTRTIPLLGRKSTARVMHTLLGYEVKASYKRIHCPDRVTARYLKIFMEIGCRSIKLPYDPTVTARLLPELEESMKRMQAGVRKLFPKSRTSQAYVLRRMCGHLRRHLQGP